MGASLLAMAIYQPTLMPNGPPLSRAGSLPQSLASYTNLIYPTGNRGGIKKPRGFRNGAWVLRLSA
ncbi:hypothetical protein FGE05_22105 [Pseudomonas sp. ICMP22404]|nr:hypothetical protein FGE05_22105 [Pseudomonas sp. ICMP22404]